MATSNFMLNNRVTQLAKTIGTGGGGSQTLAQVMDLGNIASQDLNMNNKDITSAYQITGTIVDTVNMSVDSITSNVNFTNTATFGSIPQCSIIPTIDTDLVNKKYIDDNIITPTLQTVLDNGHTAENVGIILNDEIAGTTLFLNTNVINYANNIATGRLELKETGDFNLSSNGTISLTGITTFDNIPQCSIVPTTDNDLVNKKYVDDEIATITPTLQTVLNNGNVSTDLGIILSDTFDRSLSLDSSIINYTTNTGFGLVEFKPSNDLHLYSTGTISLTGSTTFDNIPQCSIVPTTDNDLVNKKYIDDSIITPTLQTVLDNGHTAEDIGIILNEEIAGRTLFLNANVINYANNIATARLELKETGDFNLSSNGTISLTGSTTFDNIPQCSIVPTIDTDITNKKYVDDAITTNNSNIDLQTVLDNNNQSTNDILLYEGTKTLSLGKNRIDLINATNFSILEFTEEYDLHLYSTGTISLTGSTTFDNIPQCSIVPTIDTDITNKKYVDDAITTNNSNIDLQTVLDNGSSANLQTIELTSDALSSVVLNTSTLNFVDTVSNADITYSNDYLYLNANNINLNGQATFSVPPHSTSPILGNDLATKGYVDSLVGQYSGGYNLYLNYSESVIVNSISYKKLSNTVSSASQQSIVVSTTGTEQLLASFISDELNILEIPAGLWSLTLYGGVSSAGGILYYHFHIRKYSGGTITNIVESGNSPDVNATPSTNPDAYNMNATISTAVSVLLTDRIIIDIYYNKISGGSINLTTYFESSYYSFIQSTLNAGTTLLSSTNNWTGNNTFQIIPTTLTATAGSNNTQLTTTAYIYNALSSYLLSATASATYATIASLSSYLTTTTASATYLTIANASSTYATIASLASYLTIIDASSTYATIASLASYLTIANASSTYATIASLSSYLTTATASATYLTIANASSTYATIASLSSYLTTATASATYLTIANASSTYATIASLASYLTTAIASATYAPLISPSFTSGATVGSGNLTITSGDLTLSNTSNSINTSIIGPSSNSNTCSLASGQTSGVLNIGTGARTTAGNINIGTGSGATVNQINIGGTGSAITLNGTVGATTYNGSSGGGTTMTIGDNQISGDIRIGSSQTSGDIWIGQNASRNASGQILIGTIDTASAIVPITIGNTNSTTTLNGTVSFTNTPTAPTAPSGNSSTALATTAFISNALSSYLTTATASATYATIASLSSYLTTATASATYATIASLSSYLTTATASTTYAPIVNPTFSTGVTLTSGNITASSGNIIGTLLRNGANSGSISSTGVINASALTSPSLTTATATTLTLGTATATAITVGASGITTTNAGPLTSTGLITANGNIKSASVEPITTGGNLDLGTSQLGGAMSIGTSKTSGFIAIGNPSNSTHSVIINSITAFNQGVTLNAANAYGIQTATTTFTAGNTNIGYQSSGTGTAVGALSTTISSACLTISTLQIGFYIIIFSGNITSFSVTTNSAQPTITLTGGTSNMTKYNVGSTTAATGFTFTGPIQITNSTNSITLQFTMSAGTANMSAVPTYSYIRIA